MLALLPILATLAQPVFYERDRIAAAFVIVPVTAFNLPNCDGSTTNPCITLSDFNCFLNAFASGSPWADCDRDGAWTAADFNCYLNAAARGDWLQPVQFKVGSVYNEGWSGTPDNVTGWSWWACVAPDHDRISAVFDLPARVREEYWVDWAANRNLLVRFWVDLP